MSINWTIDVNLLQILNDTSNALSIKFGACPKAIVKHIEMWINR